MARKHLLGDPYFTQPQKLQVGRVESLVTNQPDAAEEPGIPGERIQVNVRLEKSMMKVLKALAEYHDVSLTQALEDIVLYALEGTSPFTSEEDKNLVKEFKRLYKMDYDIHSLLSNKGP